MKQSAGLEMILVAFLLGAAMGILYSRWMRIENRIAGYGARLLVLEQRHAELLQDKATRNAIVGFALRCLNKITFGFFKGA